MSKRTVNYSYLSVQKQYKKFKQREVEHLLVKDLYIIRLDGKGMTKVFKQDHFFHKEYYEAMKTVLKKLPEYFPYISFAYTSSDEISLLLDFQKIISDKWYKNRQEKLLTIISSYVSSLFNQSIKKDKHNLFAFDARLIEINTNECIEYFKSRQAYSFCSFFDFAASKEKRKIKSRTTNDLEKLLSKDYYKDFSYVCYGYAAFYLNNKWVVEKAKNIDGRLQNTKINSKLLKHYK